MRGVVICYFLCESKLIKSCEVNNIKDVLDSMKGKYSLESSLLFVWMRVDTFISLTFSGCLTLLIHDDKG